MDAVTYEMEVALVTDPTLSCAMGTGARQYQVNSLWPRSAAAA
jgi:hypothetical protein